MTAAAKQAARPRRMSLWRLEWLRLVRTPRATALAAVFILFGLIEPVVTKYQNKLIGHVSRGVHITLPPPTPADALSGYIGNASVIGLIVVVAIAAGAFGFDVRQGVSTFLRTRVSSIWQLVTPRYLLNVAAAAAGYLLGTLAAWYEIELLIGHMSAGNVLAGVLCQTVYLALAVALTALAASLVRNTLGAVGIALGVLLAMPIIGAWHAADRWLPSALVNAPVDLVSGAHHLQHFVPALAVAAVAAGIVLALAVLMLRRREA
jgi:ABC-2 type transport system permease protein